MVIMGTKTKYQIASVTLDFARGVDFDFGRRQLASGKWTPKWFSHKLASYFTEKTGMLHEVTILAKVILGTMSAK